MVYSSPRKGAVLTTLIPFRPQRVPWQTASFAALPTHMFSPVNPKRVNWNNSLGQRWCCCYSSTYSRPYHQVVDITCYFFPCSLSLENTIQPPERQTQALRTVQLILSEESSSYFSWMTHDIQWPRKQSKFRAKSNSQSAPAAWTWVSGHRSHAMAKRFQIFLESLNT